MSAVRSTRRTPASPHKWGKADFSAFPLWVAAWAEFQAAQGRSGMVDGVHDQGRGRVPRWFVTCELGEGECQCARCFGDPGRLSETYARWLRVNRTILDELARDAPERACSAAQTASPPGASLSDAIAALRRHLEDP